MPEVLGRLRPPRLASPPALPAAGEEYYDTGLNQLLYWNGTTWIAGAGSSSSLAVVYANTTPFTSASNTIVRAVVANGTINLPPTPNDKDVVVIEYEQSTGTLTVAVNSILGIQDYDVSHGSGGAATITVPPKSSVSLVCDAAHSSWVVTNRGGVPSGTGGTGGTTIINAAPVPQNTAARAYRNATFTTAAGAGATKIPLDTVAYDPGGNFQIANSRYICPVAGYYQVDACVMFAPGAINAVLSAQISKNGVQAAVGRAEAFTYQVSQDYSFPVADTIQCNAGDYLEVWAYTPGGIPVFPGSTFTYMSVAKVDVAGAWGANPLNTAARAYRNATQTLPASTWTKIGVDTLSYDPGGCVNVANGRYVCPTAGYYQFDGQIGTASGNPSVAIYKNGVFFSQGITGTPIGVVGDVIQCSAGDYLELWGWVSTGVALGGGPGANFLAVSRVDMVGSGGPGFSMNTAARAWRLAAFSLPGAAVVTKIPLDMASFDAGQNLQLANGRYVCPVGGYYQVDGEWLGSSPAAGVVECYAGIYKNGVRASLGAPVQQSVQVGSDMGAAVSDVIQCSAGDYLELWGSQSAGSPAALAISSTYNYLSVVKVDVGGTPGPGWKQYTGTGTPTLTQVPGNVGDSCVRTSDGEVFQQVAGAWADQSWSLQGASTPYFLFVRRDGAHNGGNAGVGYVPLYADTVLSDASNLRNVADGHYTCPVSGRYRVRSQLRYTAISSLAAVALYKNGTMYVEGDVQPAVGAVSLAVDVLCVAGDQLQLYVYHGAAASSLNSPAGPDNWWQVELAQASTIQQQPVQAASQARAYRNAALTLTASAWTKIAVDTASFDAGQNLQLANGRYVCPVGGYYQVDAEATWQGGASIDTQTGIAVYKNGTLVVSGSRSPRGDSTGIVQLSVADVIQCNPGDYLELWALSNVAYALITGPNLNYLSASLVGTQPTAAPANAARAHRAAALTPAASTWTKIPMDAVDTDPGGNFSVANGRYVCPVAGIYDIVGALQFNESVTGTYTQVAVGIYKNGLLYSYVSTDAAVVSVFAIQIADKIQCNAGDYFELWAYNTQGTSMAVSSQTTWLAVSLLTAAPAPLPVTTPQVVTAGLPSNPVDGQECYFVADAANGVVWHLKYRAADPSAHKWQFVGGAELFSGPAGSVTTTSGGYVPLSGFTAITVPLPGDYISLHGALAQQTVAGAQALNVAVAKNGAAVGFAATVGATGSSGGGEAVKAQALTGLNAGDLLTVAVDVGGGASTLFTNGWIRLQPRRVG